MTDKPEMTPAGYLLTKSEQEDIEAMNRLSDIDRLNIHVWAIQCAVRAMFVAHPNQKQVKETFEQLYYPLLTNPFFIGVPDRLAAHRAAGKTIFAPVVS